MIAASSSPKPLVQRAQNSGGTYAALGSLGRRWLSERPQLPTLPSRQGRVGLGS